jgi:hypothetical protein
MMKTFQELFNEHTGRGIIKWSHYPAIYDKHFWQYRDKEITVLEIGVQRGGSLEIWEKYFPKAKIYGIDLDERCKGLTFDRAEVFIGDQTDKHFLAEVRKKIGPIDIIIDDGSHVPEHQRKSFEQLYMLMNSPGVYLVEDTEYNFVTVDSQFIDHIDMTRDFLNYRDGETQRITNSITHYNNVVVIEKQHSKPVKLIKKNYLSSKQMKEKGISFDVWT